MALWNSMVFMLVSAVLGAGVGLCVWLFLLLMKVAVELLWHALPGALGLEGTGLLPFWFIAAVTCTGALAIFLVARVARVNVVPLMQVMGRVKATGRCEYRGKVGGYFAAALAPLAFGAAVGPEAGLVNVAAALCTWVGDRLRFLEGCRVRATLAGRRMRWAELRAVFGAGDEGVAPLDGWRKRAAYTAAIAGGICAYAVAGGMLGGGLAFARLPTIAWSWAQMPWAIPCLAVGVAVGVVYSLCDKAATHLGNLAAPHPLLRNVGVALVLSLAASCIPFALFSGEEDMGTLVAQGVSLGAAPLALIALCRCVCTPLCIHCGWKGGQFFPLIFMGVAAGYCVAACSGVDPVFCAALVSASMLGVVMRKWAAAALLMLLVMPLGALPLLVVAAFAGSAIPLPASWGVGPAWSPRCGKGRRVGRP